MVVLRDSDYFDGKLYAFCNDEVLKIAKVYAKEKQMPLYLIVDEALRRLLTDRGVELPPPPKVPQLI